MPGILIVSEENEVARQLVPELARHGFTCAVVNADEVIEQLTHQTPELVLLETDNLAVMSSLSGALKQRNLPTIILARLETISSLNGQLEADDFVIKPYDLQELVVRAKRLLHKNDSDDSELLRYGDLTIDTARCEVTVAGCPKMLTYKEYELLKFLASNPDRVFTRDTLLNRAWGHDYFGGDRTVDVHVRRLRSKLEDSSHYFIETVRNIGYRFSQNT